MSDSDSALRRGLESSRLRGLITSAVPESRFVDWVSAPVEWLSSSIDSATAPIRVGLSQIVTHSFIYRWITKDPDPEVIVIDPRDTHTVGPVINILEKTFVTGTAALRSSRSIRIIERFREGPLRVAGVVVASLGVIQAAVTIIAGNATPAGLIIWCAVTVAGLGGIADTRSWGELGGSKTDELLMMIFEPPEPADAADSAESNKPTEQPTQLTESQAPGSEASHVQESE